MAAREYTVQLEAFEGPLDLLLFLIRRAEVDIHDIPIAAITEQYLAFLAGMGASNGTAGGRSGRGRLDIEQAGEFLVMAATLMEIKSRMIGGDGGARSGDRGIEGEGSGAQGVGGGDGAVDPRAELVRQLLEYKRFRDATDRLEEWRTAWDERFPSAAAVVGRPGVEEVAAEAAEGQQSTAAVDIDDLQIIDLVEAFARIVESVDFNRVGEHRVVVDDTPVEVHGERIVRRLTDLIAAGTPREHASVAFASLFVERTRSEMIGVFLAVLELVKQQRVLVRQESATTADGAEDAERGEIVLMLGVVEGVGGAGVVVTAAAAPVEAASGA